MLCFRQHSHFIKVAIILLVLRSSSGFPRWSTEEENSLYGDSQKGDTNLNDDLYNLLKKALTLEFGPEKYLDDFGYMSELKSDDFSNRLPSSPSSEAINSKLWDEINDRKYEQFSFGDKDTATATKRNNDLNRYCQKGNVFGSWLNRLCNERRSG